MSVCNFYFGYPFVHFLGNELSFWLSACSVLIVVPLLLQRSSFHLMSWTEGHCFNSWSLSSFLVSDIRIFPYKFCLRNVWEENFVGGVNSFVEIFKHN